MPHVRAADLKLMVSTLAWTQRRSRRSQQALDGFAFATVT